MTREIDDMDGQMSLFDWMPETRVIAPGDWLNPSNIGREMSFDEAAEMIGQIVAVDMSTASHWWAQAVRLEKVIVRPGETMRYLVYYSGKKQRGLVGEYSFNPKAYLYPARMWTLR